MFRSRCTSWFVGLSLLGSTAAWAQSGSLPPPPVYTAPDQPVAPAPQPYVAQPYVAQPYAPQPYYVPQPYQPGGPQAYTPTYVAPPTYAPAPMTVRPPAPRYAFRPQFGLGFRAVGAWGVNSFTDFGQGGLSGDLLFRIHPRVTLEMTATWLGTTYNSEAQTGYSRYDVPLTLGVRVYPGHPAWVAAPYFVFATGAGWARATTPVIDQDGLLFDATETAWFWDGQAGGGVELRLGRHVALNADVRVTTRLRIDRGQRLEVIDAVGNTVPIMGHQGGVLGNLGLSVYF